MREELRHVVVDRSSHVRSQLPLREGVSRHLGFAGNLLDKMGVAAPLINGRQLNAKMIACFLSTM